MKDKRTYKMCARLLPYRRQCNDCKHTKTCSLFCRNDFEADNNDDKAMSMFVDDRRQGITESFVLNAEEAI